MNSGLGRIALGNQLKLRRLALRTTTDNRLGQHVTIDGNQGELGNRLIARIQLASRTQVINDYNVGEKRKNSVWCFDHRCGRTCTGNFWNVGNRSTRVNIGNDEFNTTTVAALEVFDGGKTFFARVSNKRICQWAECGGDCIFESALDLHVSCNQATDSAQACCGQLGGSVFLVQS